MIHDSIQQFLLFNKSLDGKSIQLSNPIVILIFLFGGYLFVQSLLSTNQLKKGKETNISEGKGWLLAFVVLVLFIIIISTAK